MISNASSSVISIAFIGASALSGYLEGVLKNKSIDEKIEKTVAEQLAKMANK